jgi:isoquinoline 1-oxidoreductase subunit beta
MPGNRYSITSSASAHTLSPFARGCAFKFLAAQKSGLAARGDSIVGMIAEVAVANGAVKVERVVIACDCGVVVNPRGVETQLEGGMIYGLSAALFAEITVKNGRVEQGNFDTYPVVRFKDAPKTEVYITPTPGKKWGGIGEPGATMIQPAVTNAIFAATGKRLRTLPIRGQDLSGAA